MSIIRHTFNTLPSKPEYVRKVVSVLSKNTELSEKEIVLHSGLTKTQSLCALVELIKIGRVIKIEKSKCYRLKNSEVN